MLQTRESPQKEPAMRLADLPSPTLGMFWYQMLPDFAKRPMGNVLFVGDDSSFDSELSINHLRDVFRKNLGQGSSLTQKWCAYQNMSDFADFAKEADYIIHIPDLRDAHKDRDAVRVVKYKHFLVHQLAGEMDNYVVPLGNQDFLPRVWAYDRNNYDVLTLSSTAPDSGLHVLDSVASFWIFEFGGPSKQPF